jgi:hypothetical protein
MKAFFEKYVLQLNVKIINTRHANLYMKACPFIRAPPLPMMEKMPNIWVITFL